MTLNELSTALKEGGIDNYLGEARQLFCHFGGFSPLSLVGQNPTLDTPALCDAVSRRLAGEPLQYIIGEVVFYNEVYRVTPACLIPSPDTEVLVEEAIRLLPAGAIFADLCTGSGCIAISTLAHRTVVTAYAYDISGDALALAIENAKGNGVADRVTFSSLNVLEEAPAGPLSPILSNPPYIATSVVDTLTREVQHEPRIALDGGADGMDFYRAILTLGAPTLAEDGFFLFEIGYDQETAIKNLANTHGFDCHVTCDLGGNPRVAHLTKRQK
jgi:release factor glutamine methyltransferase